MPDAQVTRRSSDGKWHGVNKDPGLSPYLVLRFNNHNDIQILDFYLEHGKLRMNGTVHADGGDPYPYPCHYKRTSVDPEAEGVSPDHLATQSRSPSASAWASSAVKTNDPMT